VSHNAGKKRSRTNDLAAESESDQHVLDADFDSVRTTLIVPARPEMWSIVRLTTSALATRLDYQLEDVEDLRIAITELCMSIAVGAAADATCECQFDISPDRFEVVCRVFPVRDQDPSNAGEFNSALDLSKQILGATVEQYNIDPVEDGVRSGYLSKERGLGASR
jgi:serine/threonine-protein kinase RsbW